MARTTLTAPSQNEIVYDMTGLKYAYASSDGLVTIRHKGKEAVETIQVYPPACPLFPFWLFL